MFYFLQAKETATVKEDDGHVQKNTERSPDLAVRIRIALLLLNGLNVDRNREVGSAGNGKKVAGE